MVSGYCAKNVPTDIWHVEQQLYGQYCVLHRLGSILMPKSENILLQYAAILP